MLSLKEEIESKIEDLEFSIKLANIEIQKTEVRNWEKENQIDYLKSLLDKIEENV